MTTATMAASVGFQQVPSNNPQDHCGGYTAEQASAHQAGGYQVPPGSAVNPAGPSFAAPPVQNYATAAGTPQLQNMYWATPRPQNFYQSYPIPTFSPENSRSSHQYETRCAPPPTHPPQLEAQLSNTTYDQQINNNPRMNNNFNQPTAVYQPVPYTPQAGSPATAMAQPQLVYTTPIMPQKPPMTSGKAQAGTPITSRSPFREATVARVLMTDRTMSFPQLYYNQQLLDNGKPAAGSAAQSTWCQHTMTPTHARPPTPTQPSKPPFAKGDAKKSPPQPQSKMMYRVVRGGVMVMSTTPSPPPAAVARPEFKNTGEAAGARSPEHWADRSNSGASTESTVSSGLFSSDDPMVVPTATSPSNASNSLETEKDGVRNMAVTPSFDNQGDKKAELMSDTRSKTSSTASKVSVEPPTPLHPPPLKEGWLTRCGPVMPNVPAESPPIDMDSPYETEESPQREPAPLAEPLAAPLATYTNPTSNLNVYAPQEMEFKPPEENVMQLEPTNCAPVTCTPALDSIVPSEGRTTPGSTYKQSEPLKEPQEMKQTNMESGSSPTCNIPNEPLPPSTALVAPAPQVQAPDPEVQEPAPKVQASAPKVQASTPKVQAPAPKVQPPAPKVQTPAPKVQASAPKVQAPDPKLVEKPARESSECAEKVAKRAPANDAHLAHLLAPLSLPPKEEPWQVKCKRKRRKPRKTDVQKPVEFESEESRGSSITSSKPSSPKKLTGPEAEAKRAARAARNQRKKLRRRQKRRSKEQKSKDGSVPSEPTRKGKLKGAKTTKTAARQSACAWLQGLVYSLLSPIIPMSLAKQD